mmetsp:Transcript_109726/g.321181  ORF Transcript_109726/g.321181 Transcript_109726/m.321181 type:complete len:266 (-) Transcript_109726:606-1403(-)
MPLPDVPKASRALRAPRSTSRQRCCRALQSRRTHLLWTCGHWVVCSSSCSLARRLSMLPQSTLPSRGFWRVTTASPAAFTLWHASWLPRCWLRGQTNAQDLARKGWPRSSATPSSAAPAAPSRSCGAGRRRRGWSARWPTLAPTRPRPTGLCTRSTLPRLRSARQRSDNALCRGHLQQCRWPAAWPTTPRTPRAMTPLRLSTKQWQRPPLQMHRPRAVRASRTKAATSCSFLQSHLEHSGRLRWHRPWRRQLRTPRHANLDGAPW